VAVLTSEQLPEDGQARPKHVAQFNNMKLNAILSKEVIVNKFALMTEISA
jgi:hypothetical protein